MPSGGSERQSQGPATDRSNNPVVDPTQNVLDLVAASVTRLDDLRTMESAHIREIGKIRDDFNRERLTSEAARLDAIRSVDNAAVTRAAEVATEQAKALATVVATSAETLRGQVEATKLASAAALTTALDPIKKDVAELRQVQYETAGQKTQVVEGRASGANVQMWVSMVVSVLAFFISIVVFVISAIQ